MTLETNIMQKMRVKLVYSNPFFGHLLMACNFIEDSRLRAPMAVGVSNGIIDLYYNIPRLNQCIEWGEEHKVKTPFDCVLGVGEHECLHVIFKHFLRVQNRDAILLGSDGNIVRVWNLATDMAINQYISKPLPLNPIVPEMFSFPRDLSAEQYYDLLVEKYKKSGNKINMSFPGMGGDPSDKEGEGEGEGGEGDDKDTNSGGEADGCGLDDHSHWKEVPNDIAKKNDIENMAVRNAVVKAMEHAKKMGNMPGKLAEQIANIIKEPEVDYWALFRDYVGGAMKIDSYYTWKRPHRRYGEEQKGKRSVRMGKLVLVIDTSGSIGDKEFAVFTTQIHYIRLVYKCEVDVIEIDADVQKHYKLRAGAKLDTEFKGRGGTDFRPAFDYIKKKGLNPDVVVYLTDLDGTYPDKPPHYPLIWVATPNSYRLRTNKPVPFGKLIKIKAVTEDD